MKTDTILILGAAAAAVYAVAVFTRRPAAAGGGTAQTLNNGGAVLGTAEIPNTALPGQTGWGWRYYSDGTAIDPVGNYYSGGQLIWRAT